MKILVLNPIADRHIAAITNVVPEATVFASDIENASHHIADTDILVAWGFHDIRNLYAKADNIKWVHALSAGVEKLIFPELQNSAAILTNSKGIHGIPVAEHVFAMMLSFTRGLNLFVRQQIAKQWKRVPTDEIHDKTIGIVGLGSIGREIAKRAKCLGLHVLAVKREMTNELFVDELYSPDHLGDMLAIADFVVVAVPLTEETRGMFGLDQFRLMKPSAYFINIARGAVVREADLITALEQKIIQGAGLDVFEHEPLAETSPLWDMSNVIITPHLAALSPYYLDRAIKLFVENLTRYALGREMFNIVDKTKGY